MRALQMMLYVSGFIDDVTFSYNGQERATRKA